jgi:hypothetical protein
MHAREPITSRTGSTFFGGQKGIWLPVPQRQQEVRDVDDGGPAYCIADVCQDFI